MTAVLIELLVISFIVFPIGIVGYYIGKIEERRKWSRLITRGVLPDPEWSNELEEIPEGMRPYGATEWIRAGYRTQIKSYLRSHKEE